MRLEDYSDGIGGNAPVDKADDFFSYLYLILINVEVTLDILIKGRL